MKAPGRSSRASVKAPRRAPNSSLSAKAGGTEAQFTEKKGLSRRRLESWMKRATALFPVPVSPVRRTVESVRAARVAVSTTLRIAGLSATSCPAPAVGRIRLPEP
jgi:hypothetical protein